MIPTIIVFVKKPSTELETKVVENLIKMGYAPLVDANHGSDYNWFLANTNCPHRLYNYGDNCGYTIEESDFDTETEERVDVMIAFNHDEELDSNKIKMLDEFLTKLSSDYPQPLDWLEKQVVAPLVQDLKNTDVLGEAFETVAYPDCYGFRQIFRGNVGFYEITKPNTDRPYTTYIENYEENGRDLFSNFFIATSWGVAAADVNFLRELWKWKMMDTQEPFDCEKLLKERTERCNAGEPEPRVYRKTLEDVIEVYEKISAKVGDKRKSRALNGAEKLSKQK